MIKQLSLQKTKAQFSPYPKPKNIKHDILVQIIEPATFKILITYDKI